MNRLEIEEVGFEVISQGGHVKNYVYHRDDETSIILEEGSVIVGNKIFPGMFILKEISKSKISKMYSGPIKNKKELKWLINLQ